MKNTKPIRPVAPIRQNLTISLPNGLGLNYPDSQGRNELFGTAPNELTSLEDKDPWVGTPWHKHVRARLEPIA